MQTERTGDGDSSELDQTSQNHEKAEPHTQLQSPGKSAVEDERKIQSTVVIYRYLTFDEEDLFPNNSDVQYWDRFPVSNIQKYTSPLAWPSGRKKLTTWLCCVGTILSAATPGAYSLCVDQLEAEFNQGKPALFAGITIFVICFASAPMVLAPFSELVGRKPVFTLTGIVFAVSQLGTGLTQSYAGLMISRATAGLASSVFSSMVGGVISDIYKTEDRNTPMVIFSAAALAGTGLGPAISGIMCQYLSWRWVWYLQTIVCGVTILAQILFFGETRGNVLLSRKAKALNAWYEERESAGFLGLEGLTEDSKRARIRWKVKSNEERSGIFTMIRISLVRPFHLLFTESIVFWFSMWVSFAWMMLYLNFAAVPLIFTTNHGFDDQANGFAFFSVVISSVIFGFVCVYQDKLGRRSGKIPFDVPEGRLYFACVESAFLPIGAFWLAWTQFASIHWIAPILAIGMLTIGIFSVYLAVFNYLADTYHTYSSSALAAQSFCRNALAAAIPVFIDPMLIKMTFQGGLSMLGGFGLLLTLVPWVLVLYGPKIRARSKIARELGSET